jgi:signal transduction histidine kinase
MLCVEDNGRSPGANDRGGMGLRSMRDRVEFSGGSFEATGQPGAGTRVVANRPLSGAYCRAHAVEDADSVSMMGELR